MYIGREWKDFFFKDCFCLKICDVKFLKRLNSSTPRQSSRVLTLIQRRLCLKNDSVSRCWCDISEATRIFLTTQYCEIKRVCPPQAWCAAAPSQEAACRYPGWFRCRGHHLSRWIIPLWISIKKTPSLKLRDLGTRRRAQDEIKRARARFCCSWLVRRAVPIKCTSDLRRNQRSASNPSLLLHINSAWTKIYTATYSERKVMGGGGTWASHCFQLTQHWEQENR